MDIGTKTERRGTKTEPLVTKIERRGTTGELRAAAIIDDPRWAAVATRDRRADGQFVYAVRTTGVFCRPSCPARTARPENVCFHSTAADARRAGFRPCLRCRPHQVSPAAQQSAMIAELCRFIEDSAQVPTLDQLARHAGISAYHLHRVFRAATGVTPKAYASAHRARRLRQELERGGTVTDAIYSAGYGSGSRFYTEADEVLGMTATHYRAGGAQLTIRFAFGASTLGAILVAQTDRGVCAILIGDDRAALRRDLERRFPRARLLGADAAFEQLVGRVIAFVEAPRLGLDLPLDVRGTAFQLRVWQALRTIAPGQTASYTQIAERIGAPRSVRAVAQACAANPLAVAIPCHRVVRHDGGLSGYRWGVERKRALLDNET